MKFYNNEDGGNYITFRYKVDGMPCPKGRLECFKGLSFYVDGKRVLKVDVQFSWTVFKYNLTKVSFSFFYEEGYIRWGDIEVTGLLSI